MKPGATTMPLASSTRAPSDDRSRPILAIRPPQMPTSARYRCVPVPSTTMPSFTMTSNSLIDELPARLARPDWLSRRLVQSTVPVNLAVLVRTPDDARRPPGGGSDHPPPPPPARGARAHPAGGRRSLRASGGRDDQGRRHLRRRRRRAEDVLQSLPDQAAPDPRDRNDLPARAARHSGRDAPDGGHDRRAPRALLHAHRRRHRRRLADAARPGYGGHPPGARRSRR